jgi:quinol monooxygenase YgiN
MRFARNIQFRIKTGKEQEFNGLFEKEIVPMLRRQNGFLEEVTMLNPNKGAYAISLWDSRQSAETYQTATYPQVLAKLTPFLEGTPTVDTYETVASYERA